MKCLRYMNILLFNQFFWPDTAATGQLLTDVARHLAEGDCRVTAVCGSSAYVPAAKTGAPEIEIVRLPTLVFKRGRRRQRVASYVSFLAGCAWYALRAPRDSVVITLTTPPLLSVIGSLIRKIRGATHYIWEMDIYPDIAVDLGVLKRRSPLTRILTAIADASRRNADGIIVLGECMRDRLLEHGVPADKIHVAENWADAREIAPRPFPPSEPLKLLYSGNFGIAHDADTLSGAMRSLRGDRRFQFIFAGGGSRHQVMDRFCRDHDIGNATFRGYCSRAELSGRLAEGHVGVVTQRPETLGSVVPSKTYGIMAAGRPLLFIGPREATPARIIERYRCGWQIDCGDTEALLGLLHFLAGHPEVVQEAGARARRAFLENYDRPIGVARIAEIVGVREAVAARAAGVTR